MSETEQPTDPKLVEPTEPGFYQYTGGRQTMIFSLWNHYNIDSNEDELVWCVYSNNGMMAPCDWSYIEQALSVEGPLVKIESPQRKLVEPRTQKILTLDSHQKDPHTPFFSQYEEETGKMLAGLWVTRQQHLDLGSPETITITIEPGDQLN